MKQLAAMLLAIALLAGGCQSAGEHPAIEPTASVTPSITAESLTTPTEADAVLSLYDITRRQDLLVLMLAYPDNVSGIANQAGDIYVKMSSGSLISYDDRLQKTFEEKLGGADLQDMLELPYPLENIYDVMPKNADPGRFRCHVFFEAIYGVREEDIKRSLIQVPWGDQMLPFSQTAGASDSLAAVSKEITTLATADPIIRTTVYPSAGTFNYRLVAQTDYLSFHAYGIAIDLHPDDRDYWLWANQSQGSMRLGEYPEEVVEVFESHGFIWGGKWHHFDIMHYEYRPELLLKASMFSGKIIPDAPWYMGADLSDRRTLSLISYIESVFQD